MTKGSQMLLRSRLVFSALISLFILSILALPARCDTAIVTSPHDTRQYAAFELPNRLKALVISDPETDKAAAALDVFVGFNGDPKERPGLAHFLEHMLFLGTEKYPEPDAFGAFIAKHAGTQNAYTGFAHTNYFFDVDDAHLREALDRFGQFFIAPLFAEKYVTRELSAVDAEFHTKKENDAWRVMETVKQVMNPGHPLSRFSIGNLATLSDENAGGGAIREQLIAFFQRYYSANLMTLVVLGRDPIPTLTQWVREVFSAIPDSRATPPRITEPLFMENALPTRVTLKPIREQRQLKLLFPVPALRAHYRTKPLLYIAHLLGHEGKGSLLSLLKERGWAEAINAGGAHDHPDSATLDITITLTRKGAQEVDTIIALVFQTIGLIKTQGVREWLFDELARLADIDFLFQEKWQPIDYVTYLADVLHKYPVSEVLRGPVTLTRYDETLIQRYLSALTPENVSIALLDPQAADGESDTWATVPQFEIPYKRTRIEPELRKAWQKALIATDATSIAIPTPNPFIPEDLALKSVPNPRRIVGGHFGYRAKHKPARIVHWPGLTVWFQQDTTYGVPRADFHFSVRSKVANDTPTHSVMTALLVALAEDRLTEFSYPASLAGLDYELYPHIRGLSVRISGYHDKQERLLTRIVNTLRRSTFNAERFRIIKERLARRLRNASKEAPYRQALRELRTILQQPHWSPSARLEALKTVTLSDLQAFVPEFFRHASLVALSHGNLRQEDAREMIAPLQTRLLQDTLPTKTPHGKITRLTENIPYRREIAVHQHDSVAVLYFQGQHRGFPELARMELLEQILKTPFFHQLRTDRKLGYLAHASEYSLIRVPGLLFLVQSPNTPPATLADHMEEFLANGTRILANMSQAEFARHQSALITRTLTREENLETRSDRYWTEIDHEITTFDSREQKADAIRAITLSDIGHFYETRLQGKDRRSLIILGAGNHHKTEPGKTPDTDTDTNAIRIQDPAEFKREQAVFPALE
uniref:Protease 3 n=1 Tax=Candidatus Kentrum sp. MB TaxID=2138164 RepID=A0A451BC27_9GAMM|nr:MAG: Secreted Zn-dependent peptidases, insulinase-like [Candidatus Kentron sp. MB]VFK75846.1 MAG: Secreted Zn-dependent peptidases, insulinase-like [Candidatus Kentron sp. MB]